MLSLPRPFRHFLRERRPLFERAQCRPQGAVDRIGLRCEHAVGTVDVADTTSKSQDPEIIRLPQAAMTLRTAVDRQLPWPVFSSECDGRFRVVRLDRCQMGTGLVA